MPGTAWLPIGYELPGGGRVGRLLQSGQGWQITEFRGDGRALTATDELASQWVASGLIEESLLPSFTFGQLSLRALTCGSDHALSRVADCRSPDSKSEALAFALALRATRELDSSSSLHDAIYAEKISRLLPTFEISDRVPDDVVLGFWLTGGARVSVTSFRRLRHMMSWLPTRHLREVVEAAGFRLEDEPTGVGDIGADHARRSVPRDRGGPSLVEARQFILPGRPELERFFTEHVVEIIQNRERYQALGICFPSAVVLHGPPGCGKTFAVERLVECLGWPSFAIDASSVASPYIHETSRKVAEVFDQAIAQAPSVLVIDEMEAFLADREMGKGGSHHRVEEVAEFLRRIPEAAAHEVLVVAMTNRVEMIDSAILRRGRFDHVISVDLPSAEEVEALLRKLIAGLPAEDSIDIPRLAGVLAGRPLSDVAFVVREGARLSARAGMNKLTASSLDEALIAAPARNADSAHRRIGFV